MVLAAAGRQLPGHSQGRHPGEGIGLDLADFHGAERLSEVGHRRLRLGGQVPEILFHHGEGLGGFHIAGDAEDRVAGRVVGAVEGFHILQVGAVEVLERTVAVMARLPAGVGCGGQIQPPAAVGPVLHVQADLLFHHLLLVLEVLGGEVQGLEAICFQPEDGLQGRDWRGLDVVGEVVAGGPVVDAAPTLDDAVEDALGCHGSPLEHHVFEEVGKAGAALGLQAHAHAVDHADPHGGKRVIFRDHHGQAVGKRLHFHRDLPGGKLGF